MSRCLPFPPPGYARNGIRDTAMIESIKREEERAKKERKKERKREKKEKKRKERERRPDKSKKHSHKTRHKDDGTKDNQKDGNHHKLTDNETELLEKSSLTEEHGNLIGSQNSCDSTLNSNKRQKQSPPPDGRHNNNSESVIRIRLPFKRQKDPEVLNSEEQQPCSSRGRIDDASQPVPRESVDHPRLISAIVAPQHALSLSEEKTGSLSGSLRQLTTKPSKEKMPSSSCTHIEQLAPRLSKEKLCSTSIKAAQPSGICSICPPSVALQFLNLIENWAPDPIQREFTDFEDQEWFIRPDNQKFGAEVCQFSNVSSSLGSSTSWPSACFLPEVDVHALPYTIPF